MDKTQRQNRQAPPRPSSALRRQRVRTIRGPLVITSDGVLDKVVVGYKEFRNMRRRLAVLERIEEERILQDRIASLEADPSIAIPWRSLRRD